MANLPEGEFAWVKEPSVINPEDDVAAQLRYHGRTDTKPFSTKDRQAQVVEIDSDLADVLGTEQFCLPATGGQAELSSLIQHMRGRRVPTTSVSNLTAIALAGQYPAVQVCLDRREPLYWKKLLSTTNVQATPGYPYSEEHKTNASLLSNPAATEAIVRLAAWRIKILMEIEPTVLVRSLIEDPTWVIKANLRDVTRVMIKYDVQPARKIITGKFRLVNSVSLCDQLVQKWFCQLQDDLEIDHWAQIPSKPGMGLTDSDAAALKSYVASAGLNLMSDASAWDFSVSTDNMMAQAVGRVAKAANGGEISAGWKHLVLNDVCLSCYRMIMLSDGRLYSMVYGGTMPSGAKYTASGNSFLRVACNMDFCHRNGLKGGAMAMGDDCIEAIPTTHTGAYAEFMKDMGITLTDCQQITADNFNFCSQQFIGAKPRPEQSLKLVVKHLKMVSDAKKAGTDWIGGYDSLRENMRHDPRWAAVDAYLGRVQAAPEKQSDELQESERTYRAAGGLLAGWSGVVNISA